MTILNFCRTLNLASKNFLANKKRNLLSIATVVLGSLSIGAVFTVNENVNSHVEELISRSGGPNIFISLTSPDMEFTQQDLKNLASLAGSRYVSQDATMTVNVLHKTTSNQMEATLVDENFRQARPVKLLEGRFHDAWDKSHPVRNVVLSPQAVKRLELLNPLDKKIRLNYDGTTIEATVVGIAKPLYNDEDRGIVWIAAPFFRDLTQFKGMVSLILGASSFSALDRLEEQALADLNAKYLGQVEIYNPKVFFENLRREYQTFTNAGGVIGLLALLAGAVGVMNIMFVAVQLRIREIGLYRALGFSKAIVLLIFLFEALLTLSTGGVFGAGLGILAGLVISSQIVSIQPFLSFPVFAFAASSSLIVGFIFALLPARRASNMDVLEALKS